MQIITALDYVLLPFYIGIIYAIAFYIRNRYYPGNHPWRKYFIPGLTVKLLGSVFIGIIYQYYYGSGDTFYYFHDAMLVNSSFSDSVVKWINLILHRPDQYDVNYYKYTSALILYPDTASYTVSSVGAVLGIFSFNTYLPISLMFATICYSGIWALFRTFASIYPHIVHAIAVSVLFIPSVFVWGSGIFKDTICVCALGWLTHNTFRFLLKRDFSIRIILSWLLCLILIARVKIYILIGFLPALCLWILFFYLQRIRSGGIRLIVRIISVAFLVAASLFAFTKLDETLGRYSLTNLSTTSEVTRNYITITTGEEGSAYDLGEFDWQNPVSMMAKFPQAVNVTFFRPYLWESKKVIILLSALESFLFLLLVFKIVFVLGPKKIMTAIQQDSNIQFCLIFSIIFGFAVGISSYNFGALSRYKIPALPFFFFGACTCLL